MGLFSPYTSADTRSIVSGNLIGSGLSTGGGLIGGLFGLFGQKRANEMNMRINHMNNEFNERMLDKQLAFQQEMWDKTNEYNSAKNQRARLEEAGLNPYLMMSGGNAGTASAMSGGSTSAANAIPMQNVGAAFNQGVSAVGQFINAQIASTAQARKANAEAAIEETNLDTQAQMRLAELDKIVAETGNLNAMRELNKYKLDFGLASFESAIQQMDAKTDLLRAQTDWQKAQQALTELQTDKLTEELKWLPQEKQVGILFTLARKDNVDANTLKATLEAEGIRISNETAKEVAPLYRQALKSKYYHDWLYDTVFSGSNRAKFDMRKASQGLDLGDIELEYRPGLLQSETFRNNASVATDGVTLIMDNLPTETTEYDKNGRQGRKTTKSKTVPRTIIGRGVRKIM